MKYDFEKHGDMERPWVKFLLPYLLPKLINFVTEFGGHDLFLKAMRSSARGWKNKIFKIIFGKVLNEGINWDRINSLNYYPLYVSNQPI